MPGRLFDWLASRQARRNTPPRLLEALMPQPAMEFVSDVSYGPLRRQQLDLYLPQNPCQRRRLVIFVYGGGWDAGARRTYRFMAHMLVACGFSVAIPDYRLFPDARFPDFINDTAAAVAWLNHHGRDYGIEGSQVTLIGHSAGAYNAMVASLDPSYLEELGTSPGIVKGIVGLAGPYAFNPVDYAETREIFAPCRDNPHRSQPLSLVRRLAPPTLLAHGLCDRRVLPFHSERLALALDAAGNEVTLRLYPRHGHVGLLLGMANPFQRVGRVLQDTLDFLNRTLNRVA